MVFQACARQVYCKSSATVRNFVDNFSDFATVSGKGIIADRRVFMKKNILIASVAILMLSACGGGAKDEGEKAAAADAGAAVKREAGNWKTDVKLVSLNVPGMNDQMKQGMSKMFEGMSGMEMCLTPEQAAKEDVAADMSKNAAQGSNCEFSKQNVGGGKIDTAATCKTQPGQTLNLTMNGTMEAKKVDVTITTKGPLPTGTGEMEMVMQMTSTNTGACKTT
jgi:hypothetical protein